MNLRLSNLAKTFSGKIQKIHNHNHIAVAFSCGKKINVYGTGINLKSETKSTHAEVALIKNISSKAHKFRNTKINVMILRERMMNSKPCYHCAKFLINLPDTVGIKIKRIFFSNDGKIESMKMGELRQQLLSGEISMSSHFRNSLPGEPSSEDTDLEGKSKPLRGLYRLLRINVS